MAYANPVPRDVMDLMTKFADPDPDIRYMSLSDLQLLLESSETHYLTYDNSSSRTLLAGLLKAFEDHNGEVQNQALKCLKPLVFRLSFENIAPFMTSLTKMTTHPRLDTSVPNTALRILLSALPNAQTTNEYISSEEQAASMISEIIVPSLLGRDLRGQPSGVFMLGKTAGHGYNTDAIDVAIEVFKSFGQSLNQQEVALLKNTLLAILDDEHAGTPIHKRVCAAIASLAASFADHQMFELVSDLTVRFESPNASITHKRNIISIIGAMAQSIPQQVSGRINRLAPLVLSTLQQPDKKAEDEQLDELYEASLVTLDTLLTTCASNMGPHISPSAKAALIFLKHDPNVTDGDEDDVQMNMGDEDESADAQDDDGSEFDDFEEEEGYSDADDASWKVRRCATKLLHNIISQYSPKAKTGAAEAADEDLLFQNIAPGLLARMTQEREESVKVEVLICLKHLVHKTAESTDAAEYIRISRKRRRHDSDVSASGIDALLDSPAVVDTPIVSPSAPAIAANPILMEITKLTNDVSRNVLKIWKNASLSLKHAALSLLKTLTTARAGALSEFLQQLESSIIDALNATSTASSNLSSVGGPGMMSVSFVDLQIVALSLVAAISETHSSASLIPFLIAIIPNLVASVNSKGHYKISSEAFVTIEIVIKALTPPRVSPVNAQMQDIHSQLEKLSGVILGSITNNSFDSEVRKRALNALAVLLARTSEPQGTKFVSVEQRSASLDLIYEKMKQESSRLPAVMAVHEISRSVSHENDLSGEWIRNVAVELSSQLRKSDRALRGSSLDALRSMTRNAHIRPHITEDLATVQTLAMALVPLMDIDDFHLLTPSLFIMAKILPGNSQNLPMDSLIQRLCHLIQPSLVGSTLKVYLSLVRTIAEQGAGASLMQAYLRGVGVNGDPAVLGRAIGTLLVSGGPGVGYKVDDFLTELRLIADIRTKCLALAILGEYGLHMGPKASSLLSPETFISNFHTDSDKLKLTAAFGLGNCATGNTESYLPVIIQGLESSRDHTYLLLHSLREVLQHADVVKHAVVPFVDRLWSIIISASNSDEIRPVGSECLGRLALMDPAVYIPILQNSLGDENPQIRGTIISALRFTLGDASDSYCSVLRPILVPLLLTMLHDAELANQNLALTTVKYAIHHKPELVVPGLTDLLPVLFQDTHIRPELLTTVRMGPFKRIVDDGLEIRKSAYEALYSCLDYASALPNPADALRSIFDRALAGIQDDGDIRTVSGLMITKFITIDPAKTLLRLDSLAQAFSKILSTKLKPSAVKQEIERLKEATAWVHRITLDLREAFPDAEFGIGSGGGIDFVEWRNYVVRTEMEALNNPTPSI